MFDKRKHRILLTGATGYVGGRLLEELQDEGFQVRCFSREPSFLEHRVRPPTERVKGDALDRPSLERALEGIHTAFYLIHSMGAAWRFVAKDRQAATNFARAARAAGVKKIIYLGGLGDSSKPLSDHLRSRQEVGKILRESGVPTLEFRASIIIGSGSISFEMIRSLTEKLPVMFMPKWVKVLSQPIGIEDLLAYLREAIDLNLPDSRIVEIGGSEQLSYFDLMAEYAKQRNLKRLMIPVPGMTPWLSSLWLSLVTPLYARVGRKLIDSIRHPTVITDPGADSLFSVRPKSARKAIRSALQWEEADFARSHWTDALSSTGGAPPVSYGGVQVGNRLADCREIRVGVLPEKAFKPIAEIGGKNGWYAFDSLWHLRGALDLFIGGVGMRRGRPVARDLRCGDPVDFWRVEAFEPHGYLRLYSEMRVPGKAWLEFQVLGDGDGSVIRQTAIFYPSGFPGWLYWYLIWPVHVLIFQGMIRNIAKTSSKIRQE